jgi:hypothetical protein
MSRRGKQLPHFRTEIGELYRRRQLGRTRKKKRGRQPSARVQATSAQPGLRIRVVLRVVLLAIFMVAALFWITDRPFGSSGYEAEDLKTREEAARMGPPWNYDHDDRLTVGISESGGLRYSDLEDAKVEFSRSPLGGWSAKLSVQIKPGAKAGEVLLVVPRRATEISPAVLFLRTGPGPTVERRPPFEVSQVGDHRIVSLPYRPREFSPRKHKNLEDELREASESAAHNMLAVGFHMPSLRDRRLGWGRTQLRIVYAAFEYPDLLPLGKNDAAPLKISLYHDGDRYNVDAIPEATATDYNTRTWNLTSSGLEPVLQAVVEDRRMRRWIDLLPEIMLSALGLLLGEEWWSRRA